MMLSLDRSTYACGSELVARLSLSGSPGFPRSLSFATGQIYDMEIQTPAGAVVYRWSHRKVFPQIALNVPMAGNEEYVITAPLAGLPPGDYLAKGWLVAEGPPRAYSASAAFRIE